MSEIDDLIDIEYADLTIVQRTVRQLLKGSEHFAGLHVTTNDLTEEFEYARAFLKDHGLADADPFAQVFDLSKFTIETRIWGETPLGATFQHVLTDAVGRQLSKELRARAVVRFNNGLVPFRLYDSGRVAESFTGYWEAYISELDWLPAFLLQRGR